MANYRKHKSVDFFSDVFIAEFGAILRRLNQQIQKRQSPLCQWNELTSNRLKQSIRSTFTLRHVVHRRQRRLCATQRWFTIPNDLIGEVVQDFHAASVLSPQSRQIEQKIRMKPRFHRAFHNNLSNSKSNNSTFTFYRSKICQNCCLWVKFFQLYGHTWPNRKSFQS